MEETVLLTVNGEKMETSCTTLHDLLVELAVDPAMVAVERNLEIVPRQLHKAVVLCSGDRIEIVHLVGGG
jgi:sulfur carrier protein